MQPRIGITGANGFVGRELLRYPNTFPLVGDVTNPSEIEMAVKLHKPDLICHLASISDVDYCEDDKNYKKVTDVNVFGTLNVLDVAEKYRCGVAFLSSCHVFSGDLRFGTYREWHQRKPKNYYGMTKLAAEGFQDTYPLMKIVRTSYLFDLERLTPALTLTKNKFVTEQPTFIYRSFLHVRHFASLFYSYLCHFDAMPNVLHIAGAETISWYDFMQTAARELKMDAALIHPRKTEAFCAPRPHRGGLNTGLLKRLGYTPPSYYDGIIEMKTE